MANKDDPAVLALQSYTKKDYTTALRHLKQLETLAGKSNLRVQQNKLVVEFLAGDFQNTENFKNSLCQLMDVTFPEVDMEELPSACLVYNYAVILYHSRHYFQCVHLLDKLLPSLKTMTDKKLAQQVVLLLMEASLYRRTYDKTLEIAKNYSDIIRSNNDMTDIFQRLICRAQLQIGHKGKLKLKNDTIENIFILAQQQYLNGEYNESVNTLASYKTLKHDYTFKSHGEDIWAAMNNNLGVIYIAINKPYLATKYFQHALKEHFRNKEMDTKDRLITSKDSPMYIHNLGLALLASNNIQGAFECLVEAARHYPNNPRTWMHLAQCCVKKCCSKEVQQYTVKKLGSGPHLRALITKEGKEKYSTSGESFAIPSLSLEFGALCLRNAITLLLPNDMQPTDVNAPLIQAPPGPPITWKQRCAIRNSILVLQSYILLHLQDPLAALAAANDLLTQSDLTNDQKALGHFYAAEALINLDRVTDAVEHLNPPMIHELVSVLPAPMRDIIGVSVWAKAGVCHILKGDLVTGRGMLLRINSPHVLPLQMYLEVCTGNAESCHALMRKLSLNS